MVALPDLFFLSRLLWILTVAAQLVVAAKIIAVGLGSRYRAFCVYMAASACQAALLFCQPWLSNSYARVWVITEPVIWLLYILVLLELYGLVLQDYPGIRTVGRRLLLVTLIAALLISAIASYRDIAKSRQPIDIEWALERGVLFALTVFLFLITLFVAHYRIVLRPNAALHTILFFFYFLSSTLAFFVLILAGRTATDGVNLALVVVSSLCLTLWIVSFDPAGERQVVPVGAPAGDATRLLKQLDELNAALLRSTPQGK